MYFLFPSQILFSLISSGTPKKSLEKEVHSGWNEWDRVWKCFTLLKWDNYYIIYIMGWSVDLPGFDRLPGWIVLRHKNIKVIIPLMQVMLQPPSMHNTSQIPCSQLVSRIAEPSTSLLLGCKSCNSRSSPELGTWSFKSHTRHTISAGTWLGVINVYFRWAPAPVTSRGENKSTYFGVK